MNPAGLSLAVAAALIIVIAGRKTALAVFLLGILLLPMGIPLVIAGFDFTTMRIVVLGAYLRLFLRSELRGFLFNRVDIILLTLFLFTSIGYLVSRGTEAAFINRLGHIYNFLGGYFFLRIFLRTLEDARVALSVIASSAVIICAMMAVEYTTKSNPFQALGALPLPDYLRSERFRCIGSFTHPVLAGTFGATTFPLALNLLRGKRTFALGIAAMLASAGIVVFSVSSGPLLSLVFAMIALLLWPMRDHMLALRWALLCAVLALHFVMNAPIWYVIGKIGALVGGTGWHRSELINQFFRRFGEWYLHGTAYTSHWLPRALPTDPNNVDVTNQYIRVALDGGLAALVLFLVLLVNIYSLIGKGRNGWEGKDQERTFFFWTLGACTVAHTVAFTSVSYFDQMYYMWLFNLSLIVASAVDAGFWEPAGDRTFLPPAVNRGLLF